MKDYEEMAKNVFQRIDEYEAEKKRRKAVITKTVASATSVCAVAAVGVGLWKSGALSSSHDLLISNTLEWSDADVILSEDDDISIDKHDSNDSSINRNNVPATSASTSSNKAINTDGSVTDATISEATDNDEILSEDNLTNNDFVEAYTPSIEDKNVAVPNNSTVTNNEQQKTPEISVTQTEAPIQQTTPPIQQTVPVTQSVPDNFGNNSNGSGNMWCTFISFIEWNGLTYNDNTEIDASAYTQDSYIGKVSDFKGEYKDASNYLINPDDSVYTSKENPYVLLVVKAKPDSFYGSVIAMTNPAFLDGVVYRTWKDNSSGEVEVWN